MSMQFTLASSQYYTTATNVSTWLNTTATLSFWVNTTATGGDTSWSAPSVSGWEEGGATDDIFWGILSASGYMGTSIGNDSIFSNVAINDGIWHHIVQDRNQATGLWQIYTDGTFSNSGTQATGVITYAYNLIGAHGNSGGAPFPFDGQLDDIRIYDRLLTLKEIELIYTNRSGDDIYDGMVSRWNVDEGAPGAVASGANSIIDLTGTNHGTPVNSPTYTQGKIAPRRRKTHSV